MTRRSFLVTVNEKVLTVEADHSDAAVDMALAAEGAPFDHFQSIYQVNPTPAVSSKYGAPMGRASDRLDHDSRPLWKADAISLDEGGYDPGGCYWGLRPFGVSLFCVQDGMGNIAFVDAKGKYDALIRAAA